MLLTETVCTSISSFRPSKWDSDQSDSNTKLDPRYIQNAAVNQLHWNELSANITDGIERNLCFLAFNFLKGCKNE